MAQFFKINDSLQPQIQEAREYQVIYKQNYLDIYCSSL